MPLTLITREQFAARSWRRPASYAFAATLNALPAVVAELSHLVPVMPLGFVKTGDAFQLVGVTSLQPGTNLLVTPDGKWLGEYIPATVRAFPFQLVKPADGGDSVLCFDTDSNLLAEAGQGDPFFDEEGPSQSIKGVLNFLSETEQSRAVTQRLVDALQAAGLIQPWQLNLQQGPQTVAVDGLFRIDEPALNSLDDDSFLALRKAGALGLAYAQLLSMNQFAVLQKASDVQVRIREESEARAARDANPANLAFRFAQGETFKFS